MSHRPSGVWPRVLAGFAAGGVALLALGWAFLSTEWGTRRAWGWVESRLPDGVHVEGVTGRLRSPLEFRGLSVEKEAFTVRVDRIRLDWKLLPLLKRTLEIGAIRVEEVEIALHRTDGDTAAAALDSLPPMVFPLALMVSEASVEGVTIHREVERDALRRVYTLRGANLSFRDRIEIPELTLAGPEGELAISGWLQPRGSYAHSLEATASLTLSGQPEVAGRLAMAGTLEEVGLEAELTSPARALLAGSVVDLLGRRELWIEISSQGTVQARALRASWPDVSVEGYAEIRGTPDTLSARSELGIRAPGVEVVTLRSLVHWTGAVLEIEAVRGEQGEALLEGSGQVRLGSPEPTLAMEATWQNLRWPLQGEVKARSREGRLVFQGTPSRYRISLAGEGETPGGPAARLALVGTGNREGLTLERSEAPALGGAVRATGKVAWAPDLRWDLQVLGEALDPSVLIPPEIEDPARWAGHVALRARIQGQAGPRRVEGSIILDDLLGQVREQQVQGSGAATFELARGGPQGPGPFPRVLLRTFDLTWGPNHLSAQGTVADSLDLWARLSAPDLGVALPDAEGSVDVEGRFRGARASPHTQLNLDAQGLTFRGDEISRAHLTAEMDPEPGGIVTLEGEAFGLRLRGGTEVDSLTIALEGAPGAHTLIGTAMAPGGTVDLRAKGALEDRSWTGTLEAMKLTADLWGSWTLEEAGRVEISETTAAVVGPCWASEGGRICADARWERGGSLGLEASIRDLNLDGFRTLFPEGWSVTGTLSGNANALVARDSSLHAEVDGGSDLVVLEYPTRRGRKSLRLSQLHMTATADEGGIRTGVGSSVTAGAAPTPGELSARLAFPRWTHLGADRPSQPMVGELRLHLADFSAVEGLFPRLEEVEGELNVDLGLSGTVQEPELLGEARLAGGRFSIPELGIRLTELEATAQGQGAEGIRIEGRFASGSGRVHFDGTVPVSPSPSTPAEIRLRGDTVLVVDLPEVSLWASPNLAVSGSGSGISVGGEIGIPRARIELTEMTAGAVPTSRDVVFLEDSLAAPPRGPTIQSNVRIVLGDSLSFRGFGFSVRPGGSVLASGATGRPTTGTGELTVSGGRYRAYGQELSIQRGRILFAGGPIDNPGLDIRASRTARDGVAAGLDIGGTLKRPEITLFSDPEMMQSEALSYIVLGRSLTSASTSEGNRVAEAATSLGLRGGNLLAGKIGRRFGLEEVRIEAEGPLEEAALVAGKYLSPQLYISYGVGLFDPISIFKMRYLLSSRWTLQAESGKAAGADVLYRIQRGR